MQRCVGLVPRVLQENSAYYSPDDFNMCLKYTAAFNWSSNFYWRQQENNVRRRSVIKYGEF